MPLFNILTCSDKFKAKKLVFFFCCKGSICDDRVCLVVCSTAEGGGLNQKYIHTRINTFVQLEAILPQRATGEQPGHCTTLKHSKNS